MLYRHFSFPSRNVSSFLFCGFVFSCLFLFACLFLDEETESVKDEALRQRLLVKPGASRRYISFEARVLCMPSPDQSRSLLRIPHHCCAK